MIIHYSLIIIVFYLVLFIIGKEVGKIFDFKKSILLNFILGFITIFSIFQILSTPFMLLKGSFIYLFYLYLILILSIIIICLNATLKNAKINIKFYVTNFKLKIRKISKKEFIFIFIIITLVFIQAYLASYLHHTDDDDSYFINVSNVTLQYNSIFSIEPSTGDLRLPVDNSPYLIVSWELFIAFLSKAFYIKPVILAHTVLPMILVPLAYMVVYCYIREISKSLVIGNISILIYSILNLFGAYCVYSPACFLLYRIWQGKAILVNVFFPMMFYMFYLISSNINDNNKFKKKVLFMILIMISCIGISAVGITLSIILLLCLFAFDLILKMKLYFQHKKIKILLTLLLPTLIYGVILIFILRGSNFTETASKPVNYLEVFKNVWLQGAYLVLYVFSIIYLFKHHKKDFYNEILLPSLFIIIVILNPLLSNILSKYITGGSVYWRVFWLPPMYISIALAFALIINRSKKSHIKIVVIVGFTVIIALCGNFIFTSKGFTKHQNVYKLDNVVIHFAKDITKNKKDPRILLPLELNDKIRQYNSNILLTYSRYKNYVNNSDSENRLQKYITRGIGSKEIVELMQDKDIDFIVLQQPTIDSKGKLALVDSMDGYYLYCLNR